MNFKRNFEPGVMFPPVSLEKQSRGRSAPTHTTFKAAARSMDSCVTAGAERKAARKETASPADRKLALLQKSGVFSTDTKGCTIERACTLAELRAAYALVHDVFVGTGYIRPESGGIRLRIFEACPETATFVAKKEGNVVGVLSVVLDSPELGLPSDAAFKAELDGLRENNLRLCEVTNQAVAKEYRRSALLTELMRCATAYMLDVGCDRAIATVSPNHSGFYQLVGFNQLGAERSYSEKLHDPVVALSADLSPKEPTSFSSCAEQFVFNFLTHANRFRHNAAEWTRRAKQHFLSSELLEGLLLEQRNFLSECSLSELLHLRGRWGDKLFDAVWESSGTEFNRGAPDQTEAWRDWLGLKETFRKYFSPDFSWLYTPEPATEES